MVYVIIIAVAAFALFLIFRDDHDGSYNKGERPSSSVKKATREVENTIKEANNDAPYVTAPSASYYDEDEDFDDDEDEDEEVDIDFLDDLDYYDYLEEDSDTFDVTGLRYYCTLKDVGRIVGYVKPDPSNVHDNRAQAVIRSDGKLIGYIPRKQLDMYHDFNLANVVCPFVGEIEVDNRGWMQAEIKVIIPSSQEYVEEEIDDEIL